MSSIEEFIRQHRITEVECLVPDMGGVARGKILPAEKLLGILQERGLRIPEAIFTQTVTGDYADVPDASTEGWDVYMNPDHNTMRLVPWYTEPTALVISDCIYADGAPVDMSPRHVLRRVMQLYADKGWKPICAPELEFFLVAVNKDPDYPLVPPIGRSGRQEAGRQAFGIDALNEFDPIFEDVYDFCEIQGIDVDTMSHEAGAAQMELNFNHGDPLDLADQVFLFKRTVREAAMRHNVYATFMAKPMQNEPGSAMHIHMSVADKASGRNLFAHEDGTDSQLFMGFIAGLQKYLPAAMPLLAPYVNSYRRLIPDADAPINVHWGRDNRTCGLRVPHSTAQARRVENRLPGADSNPYLAMAASLACGYLGMVDNLVPSDPVKGSAYRLAHSLPRHKPDALRKLDGSKPLREVLGDRFVDTFIQVKMTEYDGYQRVISSWERENLLLNV